jgi:hypothetical protein
LQVKVHHRYQWHLWQIMGTLSDCWHLKVNLKKKMHLHVDSTNQRCSKFFLNKLLIEDFIDLPPVSTTSVVHLELRIFGKIRNGPNGIFWGWGELDSWKNPKSKISWHCSFQLWEYPKQRRQPYKIWICILLSSYLVLIYPSTLLTYILAFFLSVYQVHWYSLPMQAEGRGGKGKKDDSKNSPGPLPI